MAFRAQGCAGLQVSRSDISGFIADSYIVHDPVLLPAPVILERDLGRWPGKFLDRVILEQKEHRLLEILLRSGVHVMAFSGIYASALFSTSSKPYSEFVDKASTMVRLSRALSLAHLDGLSLQTAALSHLVMARRFSILKGCTLDDPFHTNLLMAPLTGPYLFGGALPNVQADLRDDLNATRGLPDFLLGMGPSGRRRLPLGAGPLG